MQEFGGLASEKFGQISDSKRAVFISDENPAAIVGDGQAPRLPRARLAGEL